MEKLASGYGLIEGPVWDDARGLIFSDVLGGGVFLLDESGEVSMLIEHRRGIGGMASHVDGGLIVSGRNIAYKPPPPNTQMTVVLLDRDVENGNVGYNDITADDAGRIYAGSLGSPVFDGGEQVPGSLYLIDLDGSSRVVATDIGLTNGLAFSPDASVLYHADSPRASVFCYAVSGNGDLGEKQRFARMPQGAPDGLVVAADGAVWVALAGGSGVAVFEASGELREVVEVPLPMVTSVCFGGTDRRDLFIVTGSEGVDGDNAGSIFRFRTDVPGLPVPVARVPLG